MAFLKSTFDEARAEREAALVRRLTEEVIAAFNHGPAEGWHQRDFEQLSVTIAEATGQPISITTLKRVVGRAKSENLPGLFTLNQLAQFVGYGGWSDLERTISLPASHEHASLATTSSSNNEVAEPETLKRYKPNMPTLLVLLFGMALGAGLVWLLPTITPKPAPPSGLLVAEANASKRLPRIVNFTYKGGPLRDGVISFGNGLLASFSTDRLGHGVATYLYDKPGFYPVKVMQGDHISARAPLLLESAGWTYALSVFGRELALEPQHYGKALSLAGMPTCRRLNDTAVRYHTRLSCYKDFGVSGDDFELISRMRVVARNAATSDMLTNIRLRGTHQNMLLQFGPEPPPAGYYVQVGEQVLAAQSPRQKVFQLPLSSFATYRIVVHGGRLSFEANGRSLFRQPYRESLGRLIGIEFLFSGDGQVETVRLRNRNQETLVRESW